MRTARASGCAAELGHLFKSVFDTSSWQSHPERQSFPPFEIEKARVTSAIKREAPAHASSAFIKLHTPEGLGRGCINETRFLAKT